MRSYYRRGQAYPRHISRNDPYIVMRKKKRHPAVIQEFVVLNKSASNTLVFSQTATFTATRPRSASNALVFSETASYAHAIFRSVTQTITFTGTAVANDQEEITQTLIFTQSATYNVAWAKRATNIFVISQSATTKNVLSPHASNSIVFSEIDSNIFSHVAKNTLVFSETATQVLSKGASSTFVMTQTVAPLIHVSRTLTQSFVLTSTARPGPVHNIHVNQVFTINESALRIGAKPGIASNVFLISFFVSKILVHRANNTLVFSETVTSFTTHNRAVNQTLAFLQTIGLQKVSVQTVQQSLSFRQLAGHNTIEDLVTLQVANDLVTLPRPNLNDIMAREREIIIKRSIASDTFVYHRGAGTSRLKYAFKLDRPKALKLKNFMLAHNSDPITLRNWKGETWRVFLSSNPVDLIAKSRWGPTTEEWDVDLEFHGTKVG